MKTTSIKAALCALTIVSTPMAATAAEGALPICPTNGESGPVRLNVDNKSQFPGGAARYFLTEPTTNGAEVKVVLNPGTSNERTDRLTIADPDGTRGKVGSDDGLIITLDKPKNDNSARATVCIQF